MGDGAPISANERAAADAEIARLRFAVGVAYSLIGGLLLLLTVGVRQAADREAPPPARPPSARRGVLRASTGRHGTRAGARPNVTARSPQAMPQAVPQAAKATVPPAADLLRWPRTREARGAGTHRRGAEPSAEPCAHRGTGPSGGGASGFDPGARSGASCANVHRCRPRRLPHRRCRLACRSRWCRQPRCRSCRRMRPSSTTHHPRSPARSRTTRKRREGRFDSAAGGTVQAARQRHAHGQRVQSTQGGDHRLGGGESTRRAVRFAAP